MIFVVYGFFFKLFFFSKHLSGIPSECQTVSIQIRPDIFFGPDLGPNCLQRLSADDKNRH